MFILHTVLDLHLRHMSSWKMSVYCNTKLSHFVIPAPSPHSPMVYMYMCPCLCVCMWYSVFRTFIQQDYLVGFILISYAFHSDWFLTLWWVWSTKTTPTFLRNCSSDIEKASKGVKVCKNLQGSQISSEWLFGMNFRSLSSFPKNPLCCAHNVVSVAHFQEFGFIE